MLVPLKFFKILLLFFSGIFSHKRIIASLALKDIHSKYAGSFLGLIWNFIHPCVLITVFWVIFSLGFRVRPMNNAPFVVWLTAGMSGWFFFSDTISNCVSVIINNGNIIKKTPFKSQIFPVIKTISCLIQHMIFLLILVVLIFVNDISFDRYWLQAVYYLACNVCLALGISWSVSALNVFIRDTEQITSVLLQIGFWTTPIFWDIGIMPHQIQKCLKFNPVYYIIQGYRDSFIYHIPFWNYPYQTLCFWSITIFFLLTGVFIFNNLKPHFADVL